MSPATASTPGWRSPHRKPHRERPQRCFLILLLGRFPDSSGSSGSESRTSSSLSSLATPPFVCPAGRGAGAGGPLRPSYYRHRQWAQGVAIPPRINLLTRAVRPAGSRRRRRRPASDRRCRRALPAGYAPDIPPRSEDSGPDSAPGPGAGPGGTVSQPFPGPPAAPSYMRPKSEPNSGSSGGGGGGGGGGRDGRTTPAESGYARPQPPAYPGSGDPYGRSTPPQYGRGQEARPRPLSAAEPAAGERETHEQLMKGVISELQSKRLSARSLDGDGEAAAATERQQRREEAEEEEERLDLT